MWRLIPRMAKPLSDRYLRMYGPLLDVLREVGGEGRAREIQQLVADRVVTDPVERNDEVKSGGNRSENEVAWARQALVDAGLLDNSVYGVWKLTELGWNTSLNVDEARKLRAGLISAQKEKSAKSPDEALSKGIDKEPEESPDDELQSEDLLDVIRAMSPAAFERLCQHILRKAGFVDVDVTGRSGDGGIDGVGVLQVNELVSFRVLFQCKRYQGTVGSGALRDFRGAMGGRTDKGIIITTGSFSRDAQAEASRDGVPPIELVDGDRLVELMQRLQIGVKPRTVYDVDHAFFRRFDDA